MPVDLTMRVDETPAQVRTSLCFRMVPQEEVGAIARILSAVAVDSTHIRLTFASPLVNDPAVSCMDIYQIATVTLGARDIFVRGIVVEGDPVTSVLLTVDEMLNLGDYTADFALPRPV